MSTPADLTVGCVTHPTWLDPDEMVKKDPKGFCQGSSDVGGAWARDGQLRIPEDVNSWIVLNQYNEPSNEVLKIDERLQTFKANGQLKGQVILKASREMAPWQKDSCRY
jgi:hypothetical protein